jgi:hypothetical protein
VAQPEPRTLIVLDGFGADDAIVEEAEARR